MAAASSSRGLDLAAYSALGFLGVVLVLAFHPSGVQSGDAWISYLPGAVTAARFDLEGFREALTFGVVARPPLPPLAIAVVELVLGVGFVAAAQILQSLSAVLVLGGFYRVARRWLAPWPSLVGCAVLIASPALLPAAIYTTPDMLFAFFGLGLFVAVLDDRTVAPVVWLAAAAFCRGNGVTLAAGVLLLLLGQAWRHRGSRRLLALGCIVALFATIGALRAVGEWAHPMAPGTFSTPAVHWHPSIFLDGRTGATLGQRLDPTSPTQYGLLAWRWLAGGPFELLQSFTMDRGLRNLGSGLVLLLGAPLLLFGAVRSGWSRRHLTSPRVAAGLLALGLYLPLILFQWDTRYWAPFYVLLAGGGWIALVRRTPPRARSWVLLVVLVTLTLETARNIPPLFERFPPRSASWRSTAAEEAPTRIFAQMLEQSDSRPVRVLGCTSIEMQFANFRRLRDHRTDIRCVGLRFSRPVAWTDADFAIVPKNSTPKVDPELEFVTHGQLLETLWSGSRLYAPPAFGVPEQVRLPVAGPTPWRIEGDRWSFPAHDGRHKWGSVRTATVALERGAVLVTRMSVEPIDLRQYVRFGHYVEEDGAIDGVSMLVFREALPSVEDASFGYTCHRDRCTVAVDVAASEAESEAVRLNRVGHWIYRAAHR